MMKKVQFGCGGNILEGWENHDADVDITQRLPYADASVDFIFAEHVVEHITVHQAWNFLEECHRILVPGGTVRISVPDIQRFWVRMTDEYCRMEKILGNCDGSRKSTLKSMVFCHEHKMAWTGELLQTFMWAIGFVESMILPCGTSFKPELNGIEFHGKVLDSLAATHRMNFVDGNVLNSQVTVCVEASKSKCENGSNI